MKNILACFSFIVSYIFASAPGNLHAQQIRTQKLFNEGWKFLKGNIINGEKENFNDTGWRDIGVPHDWSIEDLPDQSDSVKGPFSKASVGSTSTGYAVGGTAWYRKHFTVNNNGNKKVSIYFDGVYMNSDVWINGHFLGNHPYGYTGFSYDLTSYLKTTESGKQNIIAVRVRNEGKNSRWYSGSGIYRNVSLIVMNAAHVKQWGVKITTVKASEYAATVAVNTNINNDFNSTPLTLITYLKDTTGKTVASATSRLIISKKASNEINQIFQIVKPRLWFPEDPYLYKAVTEIWKDGAIIDDVVNYFGVRTIKFSATTGFLLNGKKTLLRGGCVHHDNGPLGSAAIARAEERKVEILKSNGFNAVRTSHNPPSEEFLNACDRLGMLVIDEAFDQWQLPKNPQDYHFFFNEWWKKDVSSLVLRDRNHPSVIMWSIGNEIKERADSSGLRIGKEMRNVIYQLDSTRPITQAICDFWDNKGYKWDTTAPAFALLDVGGYNYYWQKYESDNKRFPNRIMAGTESFAREAFDNWQQVEQHPYVIGDFVWTAMDYMGETAIGHSELDTIQSVIQPWPWYNAYSGDIDLAGNKKPQSWYRDVVWRQRNMAMLVHSPIPEGHKEAITRWGWPDEDASWNFSGNEGKPLQVNVYTRYSSVRIKLNGKPIAEKPASPQTKLTATFDVKYEPGELKAIGILNGKDVDSIVLNTPGRPFRIKLIADRKKIRADRNDLSYVTVEITDEAGQVIPDAIVPVNFTITGNGEIAGTGNGNPTEMASFQQPKRNTFRGRCVVIVHPKGKAGSITLKAEALNLVSGEMVLITK